MQRPKKLIVIGLVGLLVLILTAPYLIAPGIAQKKLRAALETSGLDISRLGNPKIGMNALLYSDIALDADKISSIDHIKVTYDPFSLLMSGTLSKLDIIGLDLNGSWENDQLNSLTFTGWKKLKSLSNLPFEKIRQISLQKARLSVLTANAGILSAHLDLTINRKGHQAEFQTSLKSEQKFLSFAMTGTGLIEKNRWLAELEIPEAKFEDPAGAIKATRMNGTLVMSARKGEPLNLTSELHAGGLQTYGLPWQNASATIEHSEGVFKILSEAEAVGNPDIELELNLSEINKRWLTSGGFHAPITNDLINFLASKAAFEPLASALKPHASRPDLNVIFGSTEESANVFSYSIEDTERALLSAGVLTLPPAP
jgi:hypothetical protein